MNMAYLYGISDFWVTMFQDPEVFNETLDVMSLGMSDVYSRFLQTTSGVSLDDVAETVQSDIQLLLIDVDAPGPGRRFKLPSPVQSCAFISDRPFLPLLTLDGGVDYFIEQVWNESSKEFESWLVFSRDFDDPSGHRYGFPSAITETGKYRYALWATDVKLDEQAISKSFADMIKVSPEISTKLFKRYIQGLFFLYTNGPNISYMSRGLSLALGVPLARAEEKVLAITTDTQSGAKTVVTTRDAYPLPFGITPTVEVGQVLQVGEPVANIAQIRDYRTDPEWWVNAYIPPEVFSGGGVALPGNAVDFAMRTWLKTHTFVVKIIWQPDATIGDFSNLKKIVDKASPPYTSAVYVWALSMGDEVIESDDDDFNFLAEVTLEDLVGYLGYIHRDGSHPPSYNRLARLFIRGNITEEGILIRESVATVNPTFKLKASDFLTAGGVDTSFPHSNLVPLYNMTTAEADAKLLSVGVTPPATWPYKVAIKGSYSTNPTLLTRSLTSLPSPGGYYSSLALGQEFEEVPSEWNHSYFPSGIPGVTTLVFLRPTESLDIIGAYLVKTSDDVLLPVPEEDSLVVTQV